MILPNFIIFGVSRSGTTSLYQYLSQHPNIEPCAVKETRFFDMYYERGTNWYRMNYPSKWQKFVFTKLKYKDFDRKTFKILIPNSYTYCSLLCH